MSEGKDGYDFLGHDGLPPSTLLERGRAEAESYGVTIVGDTVVGATPEAQGTDVSFRLQLGWGRDVAARRLLFAPGSRDVLPDLPGMAELWGKDVHICPYCHGYEVKNQPLAVIATGEDSVPYAVMIRHWSPDLIFFENDRVLPNAEQAEQMEALGIRRATGKIRRVVTADGRLSAIEMESGDRIERAATFLTSHVVANSGLLEGLGAEVRETPQVPVVDVDLQGRTSVPGVWAAGNVTNAALQVVNAAAAGNLAGAAINVDLIQADMRARVDVLRAERDRDPATRT